MSFLFAFCISSSGVSEEFSYYILQLSTCKPLSGSRLHRLVIDWSFECHLIILAKFFTNTGRADIYGPSNVISIINNVGIKMFCFCLQSVFAVVG
jgi:hypothetical protein